jgi:hypothetical protein
MKANGNDPRAVFNTWYTGNAKGKISKEAMAVNGNKTAEQMTNEFMAIMNKQSGQQTASTTAKTETATQNKTETPTTTNTAGSPPWLQNPKVSGADGWDGMLSGPASGYRPNVTMHGTEDLKITPASTATNAGATSGMDTNILLQQQTSKLDELIRILGDQQQNDLVFQQLDKLEDLNRTMQNQISVSTKILQASR